jgi:hypothetical protein
MSGRFSPTVLEPSTAAEGIQEGRNVCVLSRQSVNRFSSATIRRVGFQIKFGDFSSLILDRLLEIKLTICTAFRDFLSNKYAV